MNVVCFFENIIHSRIGKDADKLISLWEESWSRWGWNPIVAGIKHAKQHPMYDAFNDTSSPLYTYSTNNPKHLRLCYLRWLAYHSFGCTWADLDVMNYGVTPAMMPKLSDLPIYFSKSGCCGHSNKKGYSKIIKNLSRFLDEKTTQNFIIDNEQHTNDMRLSARTREDFYPPQYINNPDNKLSCTDFYKDNGDYLLVHYHGRLYHINLVIQEHPEYTNRLKFIQRVIKGLGKKPSRARIIQAIRPVATL